MVCRVICVYCSYLYINKMDRVNKIEKRALRSNCTKDSRVEPVTLFAGSPFALL
jgi:hypothetical protein